MNTIDFIESFNDNARLKRKVGDSLADFKTYIGEFLKRRNEVAKKYNNFNNFNPGVILQVELAIMDDLSDEQINNLVKEQRFTLNQLEQIRLGFTDKSIIDKDVLELYYNPEYSVRIMKAIRTALSEGVTPYDIKQIIKKYCNKTSNLLLNNDLEVENQFIEDIKRAIYVVTRYIVYL